MTPYTEHLPICELCFWNGKYYCWPDLFDAVGFPAQAEEYYLCPIPPELMRFPNTT